MGKIFKFVPAHNWVIPCQLSMSNLGEGIKNCLSCRADNLLLQSIVIRVPLTLSIPLISVGILLDHGQIVFS